MTDINYANAEIEARRARNDDQSVEAILAAFCEILDITPRTSRWGSLTVVLALADLAVLTMIADASVPILDDPSCEKTRAAAVIRLLAVPRLGGPDTLLSTIREAYDASTYLPTSPVTDHGVEALRHLVPREGRPLQDRVASARSVGRCVRAAGPAAVAVALDVLWTLR